MLLQSTLPNKGSSIEEIEMLETWEKWSFEVRKKY